MKYRSIFSLGCILLVCTVQGFTQQNGFGRQLIKKSLSQRKSLRLPPLSHQRKRLSLKATPEFGNEQENNTVNWPMVALLGSISTLYWYWMVLAAAAVANEWPLANMIPDAIPLVPGWPPSDQDLQPVIEDSFHFFYLSELLQNPDAPAVNPLRLAAFNVDEAWIFAYLIALWKDPKRLPRPVLLGLWLLLGINLTNAFLAPYLLVTEFNKEQQSTGKNPIVATAFGGIATAVIAYAVSQSIGATPQEWVEFQNLATKDRTYLAFCVDLPLFALFQPIILSRVKDRLETVDYVPIVGLLNWIFFSKDDVESEENVTV